MNPDSLNGNHERFSTPRGRGGAPRTEGSTIRRESPGLGDGLVVTPGQGRHRHSALSLTVIGRHCLGLYTVALRALLSFSLEVTDVSPLARRRRQRASPQAMTVHDSQ
jgi:hypothetical protein